MQCRVHKGAGSQSVVMSTHTTNIDPNTHLKYMKATVQSTQGKHQTKQLRCNPYKKPACCCTPCLGQIVVTQLTTVTTYALLELTAGSCVATISPAGSNSKFYRGLSEAAQVWVFTLGTSYFSLDVLPMFKCVFWFGLMFSKLLFSVSVSTMHKTNPIPTSRPKACVGLTFSASEDTFFQLTTCKGCFWIQKVQWGWCQKCQCQW